MSVLQNAKEHFTTKLGGELKKMTVPEWKSDIFFKPAYSFAVESKIIQLQQQGKTVEALVESIILKALDPDGKPMFTKFDKNTLMHEVDPQVLIRVATELNSATSEYEEVIKN
jgi:hypothetical protein